MNQTSNTYDEVPYPGGAFPATHPSHIAMVSRLCGVDTAAPDSCRVLELGCAMGNNLIPMADSLPNSQFIGVDLSGLQIEHGQQRIAELGLKNIELRQLDIKEVDEQLGDFDFIICHGVYSWVPADVREAILRIGRERLTPNGVEYVSYNTYPGWHFRGVVREMMQYHVEHLRTPQEKIAQARALLKFLADSSKSHLKAYDSILKQELENLESRGDYYIYHDHLEEVNEPVYFHQFVQQTDQAGLRYLADTSFSSMVAQMFDDSTAELLRDVPLLRREQYMDFLRSRTFRSSLLCHQSVAVDYSMNPAQLLPMHVRLMRIPRRDATAPNGTTRWDFGANEMSTTEPITGAVQRLVENFPFWTSVEELVKDIPNDDLRAKVLECFQIGFVKGLFHLTYGPPAIVSTAAEAPNCRRLVQLQAESGPRVTTIMHSDIVLQPQQRFLARHMDGSKSRDDLALLLHQAVAEGQLRVNTQQGEVKDLEVGFFRKIVDAELMMMGGLGLLA